MSSTFLAVRYPFRSVPSISSALFHPGLSIRSPFFSSSSSRSIHRSFSSNVIVSASANTTIAGHVYPSILVNPRSPCYASLTRTVSLSRRNLSTSSSSSSSSTTIPPAADTASTSTSGLKTEDRKDDPRITSTTPLDYIVQGTLLLFILYGGYQAYTLIWEWPEPCNELYTFLLQSDHPDLLTYFGNHIFTSYIYEGTSVIKENTNDKDNHFTDQSIRMKIMIEGLNQRTGILYGLAVRNPDVLDSDSEAKETKLVKKNKWILLNAEVHIIDPKRTDIDDTILYYIQKSSILLQRLWYQLGSTTTTIMPTKESSSILPTTTDPAIERILGKGVITIYNLIPHNKSQRKGFIDIHKDIDTVESLSSSSSSSVGTYPRGTTT